MRVHPGQRVRRARSLARVGNTGQSGAPHLHFQLSDGPDPIGSDGCRARTERLLAATAAATNVDEFMMGGAADVETTPGPGEAPLHELPLHADVVRFAG